MAINHWLVKQEPETYAWTTFVKDGGTAWTGIRNFLARNHLRAMQRHDLVLYYHSVSEKQIIGLARVTRTAYLDPTATEGDWSCVDLKPVKPLVAPVTLATIKTDPALREVPLIRHTRLSVMPIAPAQLEYILKLARTTV